jgi:hypothetical protein
MRLCQFGTAIICLSILSTLCVAAPAAEGPATEPSGLPIVKFFYYDAAGVEWAVSAEPDRFERHLASNSASQGLYQAVTSSVIEPANVGDTGLQMTRWITKERERFDETRRESARSRMAEGIVAYLRAHDFSIRRLVEALKRRSGASAVELVVVHLVDSRGTSSFTLKVVLVDPQIEIGKQGFNVNLESPNASYTVVAYTLGVALYEVQELIHRDSSDDESGPAETIEPLPVPEPLDAGEPVPASLQRTALN